MVFYGPSNQTQSLGMLCTGRVRPERGSRTHGRRGTESCAIGPKLTTRGRSGGPFGRCSSRARLVVRGVAGSRGERLDPDHPHRPVNAFVGARWEMCNSPPRPSGPPHDLYNTTRLATSMTRTVSRRKNRNPRRVRFPQPAPSGQRSGRPPFTD